MGKANRSSGLGEAELGSSDCLCSLHDLPGVDTAGQQTTVEVSQVQKATDPHPFPVDSRESIDERIYVPAQRFSGNKLWGILQYFICS